MPNRILKESICTSESIDTLTEFQEVFFYRLLVSCDDYGRMDARLKILSSRLFPLRPIALELIENALTALAAANIIQLYSVEGKPYLQFTSWRKHQQVRASKSKFPGPDDGDRLPVSSNGNQMISDDIKCPRNRNRIRNTLIDNRESISISGEAFVDESDARKTLDEQNAVLDAAENAGFQKSTAVRSRLVDLYASNGLEKMLEAIESCVKHGAPNLAYLEAVLRGTPKRRREGAAHNFTERDYSDVPDQMMSDLEREIAEMKGEGA